MKCISQDTNSYSSVSLKTKNLECCYIDIHYNNQYLSEIDMCIPIYPNSLSNDMKKWVEAFFFCKRRIWCFRIFNGLRINSIGKFNTLYKCKKNQWLLLFLILK